MVRSMLVAVDGSHCAQRALLAAAEVAQHLRAHVLIVYVVDDSEPLLDVAFIDRGDLLRSMTAYGQSVLDDAHRMLSRRGISNETMLLPRPVRRGRVAQTLLDTAHRAKADWIVMGTHGRRGVQRFVMGSVSQELLAHSDLPVLLVRGDDL